jgi:two-component system response regulator
MNVSAQRKLILLVEDSPDDVALTLRAFRKLDFACDIEVARDGVEALDFLFRLGAYAAHPRLSEPVLILLDLKLPKLDGLEVLRQLRRDSWGCAIPVIVFTTSTEPADMLESYRRGANSFISKPVDSDAFFAAIAQVGNYWLYLNQLPVSGLVTGT